MESKTISIIAVVLVIFVGLFVWGYAGMGGTTVSVGQSSGSNGAVQGALIAPETSYDFGTISMKNGNVTKEFTVTNPTDRDIDVSTVFTSCMCTEAFIVSPDGSAKGPFGMPGHGSAVPPAHEVIGAGESRVIRVVYDPNAHGPAGVGRIDRFITLTDASGGVLQLEIKALVTP